MFYIRIIAIILSVIVVHGGWRAAAMTSGTDQKPPATAGRLSVSFLYMPPTEVEPTYHTTMWLEDKDGKLVKTLFVSNELSTNEYRRGVACPDWIRQASWEKAAKPLVDAVTGPTPNVGGGAMAFDLGEFGVPAGNYVFQFCVHIEGKHNVLFRGPVNVGGPAQDLTIDVLYGGGKPPGDANIVRDVYVQYYPPAVK
jgi:hypothetical protein